MAFSEEDKISIKFLRRNKQYSARKFLNEFPQKGWSLGRLNKLVTKIDTTGTVARHGRYEDEDDGSGKTAIIILTFSSTTLPRSIKA